MTGQKVGRKRYLGGRFPSTPTVSKSSDSDAEPFRLNGLSKRQGRDPAPCCYHQATLTFRASARQPIALPRVWRTEAIRRNLRASKSLTHRTVRAFTLIIHPVPGGFLSTRVADSRSRRCRVHPACEGRINKLALSECLWIPIGGRTVYPVQQFDTEEPKTSLSAPDSRLTYPVHDSLPSIEPSWLIDVPPVPSPPPSSMRQRSPAWSIAPSRPSVAILWIALTVVLGCHRDEPIVTYRVPTKLPDALEAEPKRMLAAMIPQGDQSWFFKIMDNRSLMEPIAEPFKAFVENVTFKNGEPDLSELPEGWRLGGKPAMRFATINIDTENKQLDLSVSQLAKQPDWDAWVAMNVNRWRGQVGLEESNDPWAGATELQWAENESDSPDVEATQLAAVWVDITGDKPVEDNGMPPMSSGQAPFAGMAGQSANPNTDPHAGLPKDAQEAVERAKREKTETGVASQQTSKMPPADKQNKSEKRISYDRPKAWRDGRMSMMREAAFNVGPEDASAEVTVIVAGGDLKGNVARWIGQVIGSEPSPEAVDRILGDAESRTVAGRDAQRFVMTKTLIDSEAEADPSDPAIDATIVPLGDGMSLFIKLTGPTEVLSEQSEALSQFMDSLKFDPKAE